MKRLLALALMAAFLCTFSLGCSGDSASSKGTGTKPPASTGSGTGTEKPK